MPNVTLTPRELDVLALAWQCMETQPKIDIVKLAALTGYTHGSAGVIFGKIKTKLKQMGQGLAANGPATPKNGSRTPKSTDKRTKAAAAADDDDDDTEAPTPSKRRKKATPKKTARDADDDDDDDEFNFAAVKKEEIADITSSADDFYTQATMTAGNKR